MNNTIEVLQDMLNSTISRIMFCDSSHSDEMKRHKNQRDALTKAIATLKAVESAEGLPEKKTYQNTNEWCDGGAYLAKGFNDCRDLCQIPYAKQILKNEELQEQLSNWLQLELDYNKRIKELEAKIKENENG